MIQVRFSHLDYNVADLQKAMAFYDPVMEYLGFVKEVCEPTLCLYNNKRFKLCLVECEDAFKGAGFQEAARAESSGLSCGKERGSGPTA